MSTPTHNNKKLMQLCALGITFSCVLISVACFLTRNIYIYIYIYTQNVVLLESSAQLNMRGVFLHVMGDALGSVIVIISALVVKYVEADWKYRIDPAMR